MSEHYDQREELYAIAKAKGELFISPTKDELLARAVGSARSRSHNKGVKHPRWVAVMDIFQLGSGYSMQLCRHHGFDPDEMVSR